MISMEEPMKQKWEAKHEDPPACNPTQCLTQLLRSKAMADLTVCISGHNENFKVHRLVLAMWSSVFQAMLFGPMANGDTITLVEESPEAFSWLLNYMYTGDIEFPSVELALQVYVLANKYLMIHLQTVCSEFLSNKLTAENAPEILNIATLLKNEMLIDKFTEVLSQSQDTFWFSPTIGSFSRDSLEQILKKDFYVSSESIIFKGILSWCRTHLESKKEEITTKTLRKEFETFFPCIRFLAMSFEEFVKEVLSEGILTLQEVTAIQLNIAGVPDIVLPTLFSYKKESRKKFHASELKKCHIIDTGVRIIDCPNENTGVRIIDCPNESTVSDPDILDKIQTKNVIYVNKLEYESDIGYRGTLKVKDSDGQELRSVQFDGRVAEFDMPLKLQPGEKYTFNLSGSAPVTRYKDSNRIKDNGLISGCMSNYYTTNCVLHYWE
ncbi:unnamed protein product, partial [Meganyctiphanes norvegica]